MKSNPQLLAKINDLIGQTVERVDEDELHPDLILCFESGDYCVITQESGWDPGDYEIVLSIDPLDYGKLFDLELIDHEEYKRRQKEEWERDRALAARRETQREEDERKLYEQLKRKFES